MVDAAFVPERNQSGRIFCLDFDNSYLLNGLYASFINLIVGNVGFHGNSAYFNGNSAAIEIPALTNVQFYQFGVSLWYKRVGNDTGLQGLVDNSDCTRAGSIHLQSVDQSHVSAHVLTTLQSASTGAYSVSFMNRLLGDRSGNI
jgi:hypothetical protein